MRLFTLITSFLALLAYSGSAQNTEMANSELDRRNYTQLQELDQLIEETFELKLGQSLTEYVASHPDVAKKIRKVKPYGIGDGREMYIFMPKRNDKKQLFSITIDKNKQIRTIDIYLINSTDYDAALKIYKDIDALLPLYQKEESRGSDIFNLWQTSTRKYYTSLGDRLVELKFNRESDPVSGATLYSVQFSYSDFKTL